MERSHALQRRLGRLKQKTDSKDYVQSNDSKCLRVTSVKDEVVSEECRYIL
jgi:hypothetical protein